MNHIPKIIKEKDEIITGICETRHLYNLPCKSCLYYRYAECPDAPAGSESIANHNRAVRIQEILREKRRRSADKDVRDGNVRRVNPDYVNTFEGVTGKFDGKPI
jgi:hypothetical protein